MRRHEAIEAAALVLRAAWLDDEPVVNVEDAVEALDDAIAIPPDQAAAFSRIAAEKAKTAGSCAALVRERARAAASDACRAALEGAATAIEIQWTGGAMLGRIEDAIAESTTPSDRDRALVRIGARADALGDEAVDDLVRMVDRELAGGAK